MPLRRKLLLSMVIPAILLCMMGAIGVLSLRYLEQAAGRILSDNYRSIQDARRMSRALTLLESPQIDGTGEREDPEARNAAAEEFEAALRGCEGNITEAGELDALRRIRTTWGQSRPRPGAPGPAEPGQEVRRAYAAIQTDLETLVSLNEQGMLAQESETRSVARGMAGAVTISALAGLLALTLFALASAQRISRPLVEVAGRLHRALSPTSPQALAAPTRSEDELARLRDELDALLERLAHFEDEQSRKLSDLQGRLAFVMNEVLEGLVLMDNEHRVLAANRIGRMVIGMPEGAGYLLEQLNPSEDVRRLLVPVTEGRFQTERDLGELRFEVDGSERVFRPRILTVPASGGGVEGYLILFWDVTEQRRFEESKRRFISMLSHELKTPVTSLTMSVNLLREKLGTIAPAHAELLSIATEDCSSLSALISNLIDAARDLTPDSTLRPRRVDIIRLLRSALRPLRPQAEDKGVELLVPPEQTEILANVDPVKFPWVVTNIAGNALRHTERGGRIEVAVRELEGRLEVSVKDTGTGIAPENLERIFLPYVSLDQEPRAGTHGLGLAIAREIVEAHGGDIQASSAQGRGTEFVIRLPSQGGS